MTPRQRHVLDALYVWCVFAVCVGAVVELYARGYLP
jgi:hypothetical protein